MIRLDPNAYEEFECEFCPVSSVSEGATVKFIVAVKGATASYRVLRNEEVVFEGKSSAEAARAFNHTSEKRQGLLQ